MQTTLIGYPSAGAAWQGGLTRLEAIPVSLVEYLTSGARGAGRAAWNLDWLRFHLGETSDTSDAGRGARLATKAAQRAAESNLGSPIRALLEASLAKALAEPPPKPNQKRAPRPPRKDAIVRQIARLPDPVMAELVSQFGETNKSLTQWRDEFAAWVAQHPNQADTWPKAWGAYVYALNMANAAPAPVQGLAPIVIPVDFAPEATPPQPAPATSQAAPAWLLRRAAARRQQASA